MLVRQWSFRKPKQLLEESILKIHKTVTNRLDPFGTTVMKTLLRMLVLRFTLAGLCLSMAAAKAAISQSANPLKQGSEKQIVVGPNIHVSKELGNLAHGETLLAADPKDPSRLLGCSMTFSEELNANLIVAYASFDGGKTWSPTLKITPEEGVCCHVDPAVTYGPDGTAYVIFFGPTPNRKKYDLYVYRSKDGGKTWLSPTKIPVVDRPYVVIDDTGGKFHGNIYIHGISGLETYERGFGAYTSFKLFRSVDGGSTFEPLAHLVPVGDHYPIGGAPGVLLSDGTLVCSFFEYQSKRREDYLKYPEERPAKPDAWLKVITSANAGEKFSNASVVSDLAMGRSWRSNVVPYLAVDRGRGPFSDRLYIVYEDARSGRVEIMFAYSSDKGRSWSKPMAVNDDRPPVDPAKGPNHFMPVVAVNKDGVVGVAWYDRRESANDWDYTVRFRASLDGGETFLPSVKVSEASFTHGGNDEKWPVTAWDGDFWIHWMYARPGDTAGMAADASGVFHPFWIDNRTSIPQIWTAPVTVKGTVMRNGATDLADLDVVSGRVNFKYTNIRYDRAANVLTVDARLENLSDETVVGPIKVRVVSLKSSVGIPKILNTDNEESGVGAVWDFTPLLSDNRLKPNQKSAVKHLRFSLSDLRPLKVPPISDWGIGLIRMETKILGKEQKLLP